MHASCIQGIRFHPWRVTQVVRIFLIIFLLCLDQVVTTSSGQQTRKLLQFLEVASLNSSFTLTNVEPMFTKAFSENPTYFAIYATTTTPTDGYYGAVATFDVYGFPNLKNVELSGASVWVKNLQNDVLDSTNCIQAGWEVNPDLYGDSKTHFFIFWTIDAGKSTGCYNLDCIGFVPVNGAPITPGDTLEPANGRTKISMKIFKNEDDGDWWLHFGHDIDNLSRVGYWPKSLFTNMADRATSITWGGLTQSKKGESSPPMGNGQWPGQNSASVQNVQYVDIKGKGCAPSGWRDSLSALAPYLNCYRASSMVDDMFYYGGRGGCTSQGPLYH